MNKATWWIIISIIILGILFVVAWWLIVGSAHSEPIPEACDEDTFNCADFANQAAAQNLFDFCGGANNDLHQLDADGNGIACESLG